MFLRGKTECVYVCVIFSILPCPVSLHYTGTWLQMKATGPLAWLCHPHHINPMTNTETLTGKTILSGDGKSLACPVCEIKTSQWRSLRLPSREHAVMPGLAHTPRFTSDVNKQRWLAPSRPPTAGEGRSVAGVTGVYAR